MREQKLFGGPRVRRLRKERGLTQVRMAGDLGISTSYLNLIERNQRPLTAQVLLKLAEAYDLDFKGFSGGDEAEALIGLKEVFGDPLFENAVPESGIRELAEASPEASRAVIALYHAYREAAASVVELAEHLSEDDLHDAPGALSFPVEEVRDFIGDHGNHFPELEHAAEALRERLAPEPGALFPKLCTHLSSALGIAVNVVPVDVMPTMLRRYDRHRKRVLLSEMLAPPGRIFQLAHQIALLEHGGLIESVIGGRKFSGDAAMRLCRVNLANYFAAALIMPYDRFLKAAETLRYDIEILAQRFGASFEQVCHRLTTLQRKGARGIPFFMIRVDNAGNVTKRFSGGRFPFARLGGACPRWNVHQAFQTPRRIFTQVVRMPEGATYFSIARTVERPGAGFRDPDRQLALALGCEIIHAGRTVYADGFDLKNTAAATPIGINCRLCERPDCLQRALPPLNRRLVVDEARREISPFAFSGP